MGTSGTTSADARQPYGHACLTYDHPARFQTAARDFLAAGLAAGEQVWYLAPEAPRGWDFAPRVVALGDQYPAGSVIDPDAGLAAYARATERAVADGFTGLRVAADVTTLLVTPTQVDAFARYEIKVDRYIRTHPFAALCAFDRTRMGDEAVDQLACLHPESEAPFHLFAPRPGRGDAALSGEIDETTRPAFLQALRRAELRPGRDELVLDGEELAFIDHNSLLHLDAQARELGTTAVLRTALPAAARLAGLLELTSLRVEAVR
ncbi:MEDS domain-containing protein [Actinoplanes sp. NPDC049316]|uniref:MEDS domain-containing protein n=1 Tax=Actinoplanes sp. NPDC049316 TaxID=3154727 RepID=UPI00341CFE55